MEPYYHITAAEKIRVQDTGEQLLSVLFEIRRDKEDGSGYEKLHEARHGFPLGSTAEYVRGELDKALATYNSDEAGRIRNAENDAANAQADATIADLLPAPLETETN